MDAKEELEIYLLAKMATLCAGGEAPATLHLNVCRRIEELGMFEATTPFERLSSRFGQGVMSPPRFIADAPETLRLSIEHRYSLSRWPLFDFIIFESKDGLAWGHEFVRRTNAPIPEIRDLRDLGRWSHLEAEVLAALGSPDSHEEWFPWASAVYRVDAKAIALCYVYGLLQGITQITDAEPRRRIASRE